MYQSLVYDINRVDSLDTTQLTPMPAEPRSNIIPPRPSLQPNIENQKQPASPNSISAQTYLDLKKFNQRGLRGTTIKNPLSSPHSQITNPISDYDYVNDNIVSNVPFSTPSPMHAGKIET